MTLRNLSGMTTLPAALNNAPTIGISNAVFSWRHRTTMDYVITTPCSERSNIFIFTIYFSQFWTNFTKRSVNIRKWICQLIVIWFWQNRLNILCAVTFIWRFCKKKIITMPFSEEDKYLIQFYGKTRHLRAHRIIKPSRKEMEIKRVAKFTY